MARGCLRLQPARVDYLSHAGDTKGLGSLQGGRNTCSFLKGSHMLFRLMLSCFCVIAPEILWLMFPHNYQFKRITLKRIHYLSDGPLQYTGVKAEVSGGLVVFFKSKQCENVFFFFFFRRRFIIRKYKNEISSWANTQEALKINSNPTKMNSRYKFQLGAMTPSWFCTVGFHKLSLRFHSVAISSNTPIRIIAQRYNI